MTARSSELSFTLLPMASYQQKFAALFVRMGDTGKIWNERKFKHLTGTDQLFEFKVDADRILVLLFRRSSADCDAWIQESRRQNTNTRN